jgi:hypothetical protein
MFIGVDLDGEDATNTVYLDAIEKLKSKLVSNTVFNSF